MAVNQIPVTPATPWGAALLQYRQSLISWQQSEAALKVQGANVLAKIAAMIDGSDYTRLEAQLALTPGQGTLLYAQLNSVVGNFHDTDSRASVDAAVGQFSGYIG